MLGVQKTHVLSKGRHAVRSSMDGLQANLCRLYRPEIDEMMMRQFMCGCLLLSLLTGCGKRPPLLLPTSEWTTSEPISGYQWYIDGKPEGERRAIEKTSRLLLTAATTDEGGLITWTLQVAPGKNNIIASGRIEVDPTNSPKLDWPPSGTLPIDGRTCILRVEHKGSRSEIRELFVYSMPSAKTEPAGAADSGSAAASPK